VITILVAALITTLGFGGLIALRYGRTRSRFNLVVAAAIALETIVLGFLFIVLSSNQIGAGSWLDVPLKSLALQAAGFGIAAAVLGTIFIIITRLSGPGHRTKEAMLLGLLTPLGVGALIFGVLVAQDVTNRLPAITLLIESTPSPTPIPLPPTPAPWPVPTLTPWPTPTAGHSPTPVELKVAFIADQGLGANAVAVLELIRDEGADLVLHQGDFDYLDNPHEWDQQINSVLGPDFPYFASAGNHDAGRWAAYQWKLLERLAKIDGAVCAGDIGVKSACLYRGLFFILSGVGTTGIGHENYIRDQLASDDSIWRICSWHKNQTLMQSGAQSDAVGWEAYEVCREGGAIIATGHDHTYSRTHLMDNFETQSIASKSNTLRLDKGMSFVFVSGLGGENRFPLVHELAAKPWWAATSNFQFGALFCTFNDKGVENRAHCYFKDIDGRIPDDFYLEVQIHGPSR